MSMPSTEVMDHIRKARIVRTSQMKHRDSKRSTVTDFEDALLFLAWEAEILSEGQMAKILDLDRVTLRMQRETFIAYATVVAEALLPKAPRRTPAETGDKP